MVTFCILSVLISIAAVQPKSVAFPCINKQVYDYDSHNLTCGKEYDNPGNWTGLKNGSEFYLYGRYTGFNLQTLKDNLYGNWRDGL